MQTPTDKSRRSGIGERLISLAEKKKSASAEGSVYRLVRGEFESILLAREALVSWKEIAVSCGFPGKEAQMRNAFRLERRRREKKGSPESNATRRKEGPAKRAEPKAQRPENKDPEVKYKSSFNIDNDSF